MSEVKTIYRLTVKVHHKDETARKEELHFEHKSQALKVLDRFKESDDAQLWGMDWDLTEIPLYSNANDYHRI